MALYPGAVHKLIHPGANDPPIIVIGAILHVDAGNNESLYEYFRDRSGGIESHFHIPLSKSVEQYRHTGYEADANYKANSFYRDGKRYGFVSIETQGFGSGQWNAYQLRELKNLLVWLSKTHNFPLRRAPGPFEAGVGYHTMYPNDWSPVAKSCPGPDRIKQFDNDIIPWMKTGQEEDMSAEEILDYKGVPNPFPEQVKKNPELQVKWALSHTLGHVRASRRAAVSANAKANQILKAISGIDVNEQTIAQETARLLLPDLKEVVEAAVLASNTRDAEEVANAVISEMSARLSTEEES